MQNPPCPHLTTKHLFMVRFLLLMLVISSVLPANSQSKRKQAIKDLFNKAEQEVNTRAWEEAISSYKEITHTAKKRSDAYARAVYNIGYIYYLQENDSASEKVLLQILGSNFNEMAPGGRGEGIMREPYVLYKHDACELLAQIEFRRNNYEKALQYIESFHMVYPYHHFCGNELMASQIYTAEMYGKAYIGMKDTIKAIRALLPETMETGLAPNNELVTTVTGLLKAKYDRPYLVSQLNTAIDKLEAKQMRYKRSIYETYQIIFLNVSIPVPGDMMYGDEYQGKSEIEKRKLYVRKSNFYKLITEQIKP